MSHPTASVEPPLEGYPAPFWGGRAWFVSPQGFVWLLLFVTLAIFGPERTPVATSVLLCLALLQVLESKVPFLSAGRGTLAAFLKLGLAYMLIGFTDGIASSYYWVLLLPVISGATTFGFLGTLVFILIACGGYCSFLLWIDWGHWEIPEDQWRELLVRCALFPVVGVLTQQLAETIRERSRRHQAVAEQLAAANRSLQDAEAAMRRADRLAALGQLTAGLAHELRNPMSTIRSSAEMLSRTLPADNEMARELTGYISSEVDRTNSLITRFLDFARPMSLRLEEADIASVLDRAIQQVERQSADSGVTIYTNYSPDIRPFPIDGELMERVVFNLVQNAVQASQAGSAVTVKTRQADGDVEISVIDRGAGIDPKQVESIFNPFFTTKPDGVGLGLAIVSKIVDEHGGKIVVESQQGEGSVFRLYIPMKPRSA